MLTPLRLPECYCCGAHVLQAKLYEESLWGITFCQGCVQTVARWFTIESLGDEHIIPSMLCDVGASNDSTLYHTWILGINGPDNSFSQVSFKRLENFSQFFP
jgi:hypothetical protein